MPPKYKSRKRAVEVDEYNSDGGFVEDAPKSKRAKSDNKAPLSEGLQKDNDGNQFWEVGSG